LDFGATASDITGSGTNIDSIVERCPPVNVSPDAQSIPNSATMSPASACAPLSVRWSPAGAECALNVCARVRARTSLCAYVRAVRASAFFGECADRYECSAAPVPTDFANSPLLQNKGGLRAPMR
jgi:hypothetical protein